MSPPRQPPPLNAKQKLFARELGIALAEGKRPEDAYERAGYKRHRRNAFRLASDSRIQEIADAAAIEALRLSGLHIAYLQSKTLKLFNLNMAKAFFESDASGELKLRNLALVADEDTWAISKVKLDAETGKVVEVEVPDKIVAFNALIKTMPKAVAPASVELTGKNGGPVAHYLLSERPMTDDEWEQERASGDGTVIAQ